MTDTKNTFPQRDQKIQMEEGAIFAPRFDASGLIVCMAIDAHSKEPLMLAYMNAEALRHTLDSGIAHYWSRSRDMLWKKGETSGQLQRIVEIRVDCDQDALVLMVEPGGDGGACHTGRKSCFYRAIDPQNPKALLFVQQTSPRL